MVASDLDIIGIAIYESEADPPLVVDGDGVLAFSVSSKPMESIARGNPQVIQALR